MLASIFYLVSSLLRSSLSLSLHLSLQFSYRHWWTGLVLCEMGKRDWNLVVLKRTETCFCYTQRQQLESNRIESCRINTQFDANTNTNAKKDTPVLILGSCFEFDWSYREWDSVGDSCSLFTLHMADYDFELF